MARRVLHLRSFTHPEKTLCNRVHTSRYRFTTIEQIQEGGEFNPVICPRCQEKAIRLGMLAQPPRVEDDLVASCGDEHHDDWLMRLGVC